MSMLRNRLKFTDIDFNLSNNEKVATEIHYIKDGKNHKKHFFPNE